MGRGWQVAPAHFAEQLQLATALTLPLVALPAILGGAPVDLSRSAANG